MLKQRTKIAAAIALVGLSLIVYLSLNKASFVTQTVDNYKDVPSNLILISIDTVRTDALQLYNSTGTPTPALNRISKSAHVFTNTIAQVPYTLPSHCTMLTGTYPMAHGVHENLTSKLSDDAITLSEVLKQNAYNTAGFVGSIVMAAHTGIAQGFDVYDDSFSHQNVKQDDAGGVQKSADEVYRAFLRWFEKKDSGKFFAFIHFYDPHLPYDPPSLFRPEKSTEIEMYKGELRYVDSIIGKLYTELSSRNTWKDTILVITGDHGEMLGEHQERGHGYFIYQEALKVPLLIALPEETKRKTIETTVQLVDLMPTLLSLLDIPVPKEVQGLSFTSLIEGSDSTDHFAYSESLTPLRFFGTPPLRSIQDRKYKYIDSTDPELFDLTTDPAESTNLASNNQSIAASMKKKLNEIVKRNTVFLTKADRNISPEEAEQLASLGYINSPKVSISHPSDDAKQHIHDWNDLNKVSEFLQKGKYREALSVVERLKPIASFNSEVRIFEARAYSGIGDHTKAIQILTQVTAKDPENTQALMTMAYSYRKTGQPEKAIDIYGKLMQRDESILAMQNYARLLIQMNRKDELMSQLNALKAKGKLTERHNELLGEIYLNLNELEQANSYLQKAIESNPESVTAYINLSAVMNAEGKTLQAIELMESNRHLFKTADFELQLGRLYHDAGNRKKEFEVFQQMVQTFKEDPRGYFFLAQFLLQQQNDPRSIIKLAEKGLSLNEDPEFEPFGYFLLSDAYSALGMTKEAEFYSKKAKQLEADLN